MIKSEADLTYLFENDLDVINQIDETPFYFFSERVLRRNWEIVFNSFKSQWKNIAIAYSFKTNSLIGVCRIMNDFGAWSEVTSDHELNIARIINAKNILFNGIYKTKDEMIDAIHMGVSINLDGWSQLDTLVEIASLIEEEIKIGIRLTPGPKIDSSWDKFGFEYHTLDKILQKIRVHPNIHLIGLHAHIGSNIKRTKSYYEVAYFLGTISNYLAEKQKIELTYIDLGGGFPSFLTENNFVKYAESIVGGLRKSKINQDVLVIIEPGRSLVETTGVLISRVIDIRRRASKNSRYLILDAGVNLAMGVDLTGSRTILCGQKLNNATLNKYDVFGPLCAQRDILAENLRLPQLRKGDIVYIPNIGAYDISTAYPFIRLRPPVYLKKTDGQIVLLRRGEQSEDVFLLERDLPLN